MNWIMPLDNSIGSKVYCDLAFSVQAITEQPGIYISAEIHISCLESTFFLEDLRERENDL